MITIICNTLWWKYQGIKEDSIILSFLILSQQKNVIELILLSSMN